MQESNGNRGSGPIFIVGAPRSGTSILTWCLGQHANILPQEESGWMGEFALHVGAQYQIGSSRGDRSQLSALGISREVFFRRFGDGINSMILQQRFRQEEASQHCARSSPAHRNAAFNISRSGEEPKSRWVDGTPEYSYHIAGLRKLFPDAKFVHIVRDVQSVVNSMLHFKMDGGRSLVETERQAYQYWLTAVQSCIQAECAYGPGVVHRLRYDDLVHRPEPTIRGILEFLGEPYLEACLEPLLSRRINSSCVPVGFESRDRRTPMRLVDRANRLSQQLQQSTIAFPASEEAFTEVEAKLDQRVSFMAGLDGKAVILSRNLNWCGILLASYLLLLPLMYCCTLLVPGFSSCMVILILLAYSTGSAAIYMAMRRLHLRYIAVRLLERHAR